MALLFSASVSVSIAVSISLRPTLEQLPDSTSLSAAPPLAVAAIYAVTSGGCERTAWGGTSVSGACGAITAIVTIKQSQ